MKEVNRFAKRRAGKSTIKEQVQYHSDQIDKLLSDEVERLARKVLSEHSNLNEFVMAMGSWFFVDKEDRVVYDIFSYMKELESFITEYKNDYKLTGIPMRFTAKGPKIIDW